MGIILIDRHPSTRDAVVLRLEPSRYQLVAVISQRTVNLLAKLKLANPSVIILDYLFFKIDFGNTLAEIKSVLPKTKILIFTESDNLIYLTDYSSLFDAVLTKENGKELIFVLDQITHEQKYVDPAWLKLININLKELEEKALRLTSNERRVLKAFMLNKQPDQIAKEYGVKPKTIFNTKYSAEKKLGIKVKVIRKIERFKTII